MYEPKLDDNVIIRKPFCAKDDVYVGLKGKVVRVSKQTLASSARVKVELPNEDKKYYLGDTPIFPAYCLEKIKEGN